MRVRVETDLEIQRGTRMHKLFQIDLSMQLSQPLTEETGFSKGELEQI